MIKKAWDKFIERRRQHREAKESGMRIESWDSNENPIYAVANDCDRVLHNLKEAGADFEYTGD